MPKLFCMVVVSYIPVFRGCLEIVYEDNVVYRIRYRDGVVIERGVDNWVPKLFVKYLGGEPVSFDELVLAGGLGSDFDYMVWRAARLIKYGEVRSYKWLAEQVGGYRYARAVALSLSRNPFLIVVPCHRVIRSDGSIGGFTSEGGTALKRYLLGLEGALRYVSR